MSEENKPSLKEKLKGATSKSVSLAVAPFRMVLRLISRTIMLVVFNPITVGALMFVLGARMHETGQLAGMMGKDLKGATVTLSGPCSVNGKPRFEPLAEDEVKITLQENDRILGVIRQTRELVDCKLSEVAIDKLPLLANLTKSPQAMKELSLPQVDNHIPDYKNLEKKTLVMSGSCVALQDGKVLPSFIDEKVDVTSVVADKENEKDFILTGIKKSDQMAIKCASTAIKYDFYREAIVAKKDVEAGETVTQGGDSYVGEMIIVSGTCFPDPRTQVNKSKKYLHYKMANTKLQVLEETLASDGKLKKITATAMDGDFLGDSIICDKTRFPFIYQIYDPEGIKLENSKMKNENVEEPAAPAPAVAPVNN